jgi:sterol 24-C-methyltransferase
VLKPGGVFGVYEWVMTEEYDNTDLEHRRIRLGIEEGDGIANMVKSSEALAAMREAGFELLEQEDLAAEEMLANGATGPWYWPLDSGSWRHAQSLGDLATTFRMSKVGRVFTHGMISAMEMVRLAPPGTARTSQSLITAAEALVEGGKRKLFTPMFLMVGRKPLKTEA